MAGTEGDRGPSDREGRQGAGASEGTPGDPLRALEQRLERASAAAERLLAEAAWTAAERVAGGAARMASGEHGSGDERPPGTERPPKPPPAGWQSPSEREADSGGAAELLLRTIHRLEELIPAELRRQLAEALRELLLALRALIDWWVERLERRRTAISGLEDIPIL